MPTAIVIADQPAIDAAESSQRSCCRPAAIAPSTAAFTVAGDGAVVLATAVGSLPTIVRPAATSTMQLASRRLTARPVTTIATVIGEQFAVPAHWQLAVAAARPRAATVVERGTPRSSASTLFVVLLEPQLRCSPPVQQLSTLASPVALPSEQCQLTTERPATAKHCHQQAQR